MPSTAPIGNDMIGFCCKSLFKFYKNCNDNIFIDKGLRITSLFGIRGCIMNIKKSDNSEIKLKQWDKLVN